VHLPPPIERVWILIGEAGVFIFLEGSLRFKKMAKIICVLVISKRG
jgi:hypothetical protein